MQNLSDKELDDLFRKASQSQEAGSEMSPSDWAGLEDRLNARDKAITSGASKILLQRILIGSLMFILVSDSIRFYNNLAKSMVDDFSIVEIVNATDTDVSGNTELIEAAEIDQSTNSIKFKQASVKIVSNHSGSSKGFNSDLPNSVLRNESEKGPSYLIGNTLEANSMINEDEVEEPVPSTDDQSDSIALDISAVESTDSAEKIYPSINSRFAIKLTASPDFSSVGYSSPGKSGWNYGAIVEFYINDHLSIGTGAIRSKKIYTTANTEYSGIKVEYLDGDCRVWDIPLNLNYHFTGVRSWSFYSGIGFSSYIMSKENYVYTVDTYYGPHEYELEIRRKNNEWFKMLNISVGVEKRLDKHFAIQFEPFLKAPLAGVGEGDVSLASFGAFFSLKYRFLKDLK